MTKREQLKVVLFFVYLSAGELLSPRAGTVPYFLLKSFQNSTVFHF